jgi:hypothetical protein
MVMIASPSKGSSITFHGQNIAYLKILFNLYAVTALNISYAYIIDPIRATCPAHQIHLTIPMCTRYLYSVSVAINQDA